MKLERFEIEGYQSYGERTALEFDPRVTFIAGRNNVGKSALLRGLRAVVYRPSDSDEIDVSFHWRASREELVAAVPEEPAAEVLAGRLATAKEHSVVARFSVDGAMSALRCSQLALPDAGLATGHIPAARKAGWHPTSEGDTAQVNGLTRLVRRHAQRVRAILPRRVDLSRRLLVAQDELHPDGRNLTEMLFTLNSNDIRRFTAIETFLREAFPDIERVTIPVGDDAQGANGELAILYYGRDSPIPLSQSGSGVEQMLVLITLVLTAPEDSLILIDEPQAYLHPHAERSLLRLLEAHPRHQYVIATHSHQLLASHPLHRARLITKDASQSAITQPVNESDVLNELGVTAADLWLNEQILWVEGPSDQAALEALIAVAGKAESLRSLEIRPMPENSSRFTAKNARQAESAYKFCEQVIAAVSPLPMEMQFMFDADGKTETFRQEMTRRSKGRASFLSVRELENCFLSAPAITSALAKRAARLDLQAPTLEEVDSKLQALLSATDDTTLFPDGPGKGASAHVAIKGSMALDRLYTEFTKTSYDKTADARVLVEAVFAAEPTKLEPLTAVLAAFEEGSRPVD